jgi:integrase
LLDLKAKGRTVVLGRRSSAVGSETDFRYGRAEGQVERNPALLLFTPREAKKPVRRAMTIKEVQICFGALDQRERLIAKLAILAGMRPGEIFALTWGRLTATYADIRQRVYRGMIDTPKTDQLVAAGGSVRGAAGRNRALADDGGGNPR